MKLPKEPDNFNITTKDVNGYVPDLQLMETKALKHNTNGRVFLIQNFAWLSATDEWGVVLVSSDGHPQYVVYSVKDMNGNLSNKSPRFTFLDRNPPNKKSNDSPSVA